jgi:nitroimidazol reductase NimA-like FMN-containing flavoprotein (pyridoxamine 5'-phosphate oxidase superfamily)
MTRPSDERVRVRRIPERAAYDRATVHRILDAGLVAHVGTVRDGMPVVIPMFYVRDGESILLHGAPAAGTIRRADSERNDGVDVCVTVTHLDGLVLARSAFHHSMNYRSVMVIGRAVMIVDPDEKSAALERFVEALVPGRQADLRPNTRLEVNGTSVLRLSLEQASAKVRSGDPVDDEADHALPIWAGVVPVATVFGNPVADGHVLDGVGVPDNVSRLVTSD